jgi:hypothetical protein
MDQSRIALIASRNTPELIVALPFAFYWTDSLLDWRASPTGRAALEALSV